MTRVGVEEEFVLLDEQTLAPVTASVGARERITGRRRGGEVMPEYLTCQLECVTEPLSALTDVELQVRRLRGLVDVHAAEHGAVAASTGTPYVSAGTPEVSPSEHYERVTAQLAEITREHEVNGLHVHVEIVDDEERVRALNRMRGWLPLLLALTGNSPFAHGVLSGFESWRSILIRRLPATWCPPRFHDYDDYRARVGRLVAMQAIPDVSSVSWAARLSERFPTIETRVFDAQLCTEDTLLAVAISRGLALSDEPATRTKVDGIDASMWTAARWGTGAHVVDPADGDIAPVWDVAGRMLAAILPVLEQHGDAELVRDRLARLRTDGTGATRQVRAFRVDGARALAELYREGTAARTRPLTSRAPVSP